MNKDNQHPFFRPLWRRLAVIAVCVIWSAVEFAVGTPFWGTLVGGMAVYAVWTFLISYKPDDGSQQPGETKTPETGTPDNRTPRNRD
ncbi:MAG: DUF3329 domain-containing protein [Aquamicrobium sp.]|uniref:DUF3329 domain-containing protein n=1 Tax=Mesorhizobium sp. Pch-S TaxID=2082387 RepID=UPI00101166EC|nr:DUF3329 domain-containing protein [Mesorhizobium sp. Pch-S]MBR2692164.1 DUF3329 domain-containing protein [Aquamicrobium sp.]QAZ43283.1 hypothetical protein C1M53_10180 [Mesorhizobium sp. Pch-S]